MFLVRPRRAGMLALFVIALALAPAMPVSGASTRVEMTTARSEPALALLRAVGATVEVQSADRIQAQVPARALPQIRRAHDLVRIEDPAVAVPLQIVSPVALISADRWQGSGFTGHGAKVAILDTGFAGYEDALGSSLPERVIARSFRADRSMSGAGDHGRRAAEIVSSVAPGATVYLVAFSTVTELSAAVDYLVAERVNVVSFSFGYIHNGPGDGTGPVNAIVSRATSAGVAWVAGAGNFAQQHWAGTFRDDNRDGINEFRPGVQTLTHAFTAGDLILLSLRWDEASGAACSDYDLELFGPSGALVRASRGVQECKSDPVEAIQILATESGTYGARIVGTSATAPRRLDVVFIGTPDRDTAVSVAVPQGSVSAPADNASVVAVGALTTSLVRSEAPYSSRGPTMDGRPKPNILAPTGLGSALLGPFNGTSAAAPYVAGAVALLWEAMPGVGRVGVVNELYLRGVAVPQVQDGSPGVRRLDLGSLNGIGPTLPFGSGIARLEGPLPAPASYTRLVYRGPNDYPLRFVYRLLNGRDIAAAWVQDGNGAWQSFLSGAPTWANSVDRLADGEAIFVLMQS